MRRKRLLICTIGWFACCGTGTTALAATSVLTGTFDGSEATVAPAPELDCSGAAVPFRVVEFTVTQTGNYRFYDGFHYLVTRNVAHVLPEVYEAGFDPQHPRGTVPLSGPDEFHGARKASLRADRNYTLAVPQSCDPREDAWVVGFTGPGSVVSGAAVEVPQFTSGALEPNAPKMNKWCGDGMFQARYSQSPRTRVSRTGTYYFSSSVAESADICLSVYTAPVDPSRPGENLVASLAWAGTVDLLAGRDYYFVVQRVNGDAAGEFQYVLAPPALFRINPGITDSWYNPETPGQGFFVDVLDARNKVFLAWLTYAVTAVPGDAAGQRWMTALGPFTGRRAELDLQWTKRDLSPPDAANARMHQQYTDGTISLEFFDCDSGQVTYAWGSDSHGRPAFAGTIPIKRVTTDSVQLCEALNEGPGLPGRL